MDDELPFAMHSVEGSFFLWLYFQDLPVSGKELYRRLKKRGVIVVPGEYFFPGFEEDWDHRYKTLRVSYSQDEKEALAGLRIIADEARKAYAESRA